jgi:tRNA dimethylallyltransferase
LEAWVRALDPDRAELAVEGGPQRVIRTLEVALLTGRSLSWWHRNAPAGEAGLEGVIAVVELPRELLDARIDRRVVRMVQSDLVGEVSRLLERGFRPDDPGMTGVGYREIVEVLEGATSAEEAVNAIRHATRRYSRRQRTWFRNQLPESGVLRLDGTHTVERLADTIVQAWKDRTALAGAAGGSG